jgi:hypothetical protein
MVGSQATILRTTDGGATWTIQSSPTHHQFDGVCFTDADNGTVVAMDGIILRTTTGGIVGIEESQVYESTIPKDCILSQNYPNPFNPLTMINYQLPKTTHVELTIYNLLGQKVATLVSGKQKAGDHQVAWYASGFASGVYYYQLMAGEYKDVKKMILLR